MFLQHAPTLSLLHSTAVDDDDDNHDDDDDNNNNFQNIIAVLPSCYRAS